MLLILFLYYAMLVPTKSTLNFIIIFTLSLTTKSTLNFITVFTLSLVTLDIKSLWVYCCPYGCYIDLESHGKMDNCTEEVHSTVQYGRDV